MKGQAGLDETTIGLLLLLALMAVVLGAVYMMRERLFI